MLHLQAELNSLKQDDNWPHFRPYNSMQLNPPDVLRVFSFLKPEGSSFRKDKGLHFSVWVLRALMRIVLNRSNSWHFGKSNQFDDTRASRHLPFFNAWSRSQISYRHRSQQTRRLDPIFSDRRLQQNLQQNHFEIKENRKTLQSR